MKDAGKKRLSLRARMILLNSLLIMVTLILVTGIALISFSRINESNIEGLTQQVLDQTVSNINGYIGDMHGFAELIRYDREVQAYLSGEYEDVRSEQELTAGIKELFGEVMQLRPEIENIVLIPENGEVIVSGGGTPDEAYDFRAQPLYENAKAGGMTFYRPREQEYLLSGQKLVFSAVEGINRYDSSEWRGALIMDLGLSGIQALCRDIDYGKDGYVMIADSTLNYVYHPDYTYIYKSIASTPEEQEYADDYIMNRVIQGNEYSYNHNTADGRRVHVSAAAVPGTDWTVIGVYDLGESNASQTRTAGIILFAGLICTATGVLVTILTANLIFDPIEKLRKRMKSAEKGEFVPSGDADRGDEIGSLSSSYNSMIERINDLMQRTVQDEKEKRRIELKLLQAQINPHFLYNTLDSIVWMAQTGNEKAAIMADSLAKLFKISLAKGREVITIREETEHLSNYLTIQKMRYGSKFDYTIDMDGDILELATLKLTLQPIVENAIYHGIKQMRKNGHIEVRGVRQGGDVLITVRDDGVGMPREKVENILTAEVSDDKRLGGIGVKNVNERLKMYYGAEYGLSFESEEGVGTTVSVRIPALKYTENLNESI